MLKSTDLGEHIIDHRSCPKCDYDLQGLPLASRCPECGTPIRRRGARIRLDDNLTHAPMRYLRTLSLGCLGLAGMAVALPGLRFAFNVTGNQSVAALAVGAALGWLGAVWVVTAPRPFQSHMSLNPKRELRVVRTLARLTQGFWALSTLANLLASMTPSAATGLDAVSGLSELIGLVGFIPLGIWLAHLADWAGDTSLAFRLQLSAISIVASAVIVAAGFTLGPYLGPVGAILRLIGVFASFAYVVGLIVFFFSVLQMANMTRWAVRNAETALDRDRRLADRAALQADAARRQRDVRPPDDPGIEFDQQRPDPGHPKFHGQRLEHEGDLDPYDVAPD